MTHEPINLTQLRAEMIEVQRSSWREGSIPYEEVLALIDTAEAAQRLIKRDAANYRDESIDAEMNALRESLARYTTDPEEPA